MDNTRLGLTIIGLSVVFSLLFWGFNSQLSQLQADSCCGVESCEDHHEPSFLVHGGIAIVVATLSLGCYLLFFEKSHKTLIKKLKEDASIKSSEERFNLILMGLNEDETKVLTAVKDQDGITQHTLGIRTNLHKSKLSIIVGILEEKGLIKKEKKGKTNQLFLRVNLLDSIDRNKPL
jgi:DNA-binding MarR family transcriptional regulator